jgi:hypothetical protein
VLREEEIDVRIGALYIAHPIRCIPKVTGGMDDITERVTFHSLRLKL